MEKYQDLKNWYKETFDNFENKLNGESSLPAHKLRKNALSRFMELEFPTQRQEEWKYTNISPLLKHEFKFQTEAADNVSEEEIKEHLYTGEDYVNLVFINGHFSEKFSTPDANIDGAVVTNLRKAIESNDEELNKYIGMYEAYTDNVFAAMSTAFLTDGAFIKVDDNKVIDKTIQVLYYNKSDEEIFAAPRNIIVVGKSSQINIVETSAGSGKPYFTNMVNEVFIGENAFCDHVKVQNESEDAYHISNSDARIKRYGHYKVTSINFGGFIVRNDINSVFTDEYAECTLNGISVLKDKQLVDNHTVIDHAVPNCQSHELYKNVLAGRSRAVFSGSVMVRPDAQKTNAFQENKTILLTDKARIDTKPMLEIYADDVKCTHGATIGQLDPDSIFYLRTRGFDKEQARNALINAFVNDVIRHIKQDEIKERLERISAEKLSL